MIENESILGISEQQSFIHSMLSSLTNDQEMGDVMGRSQMIN